MPSTGKTGQPAFPRLPPNRACCGHAKIDANDPTRTLRAVRPRATGGPILTFPSLHRSLELQGTRMAYDYVLAGGGSAGATLAARLSEDPKITVCLIEAGGEGRGVVVRAPIGVAASLTGKPKTKTTAL